MALIGNKIGAQKTTEYFCELCNYNTRDSTNYKKHLLTRKHQSAMNGNKIEPLKVPSYECKICKYITSKYTNFTRHVLTASHKTSQKKYQNEPEKVLVSHVCQNCTKQYKTSSGLWRHKKTCRAQDIDSSNNIPLPNELVHLIIQENAKMQSAIQEQNDKHHAEMQEQSKAMQEQNKAMQSLIPQTGNITNNNFNINIFLKEKCQNAMDITDFVNNIQIQLKDLLFTRDNNVVSSACNLMVNRLQNMEVEDRPIHCTDIKRKAMYIKNKGEWTKDIDNHILKNGIDDVCSKHAQNINLWELANPGVIETDSGGQSYIKVVRANTASVLTYPGEIKSAVGEMCDKSYISDTIIEIASQS